MWRLFLQVLLPASCLIAQGLPINMSKPRKTSEPWQASATSVTVSCGGLERCDPKRIEKRCVICFASCGWQLVYAVARLPSQDLDFVKTFCRHSDSSPASILFLFGVSFCCGWGSSTAIWSGHNQSIGAAEGQSAAGIATGSPAVVVCDMLSTAVFLTVVLGVSTCIYIWWVFRVYIHITHMRKKNIILWWFYKYKHIWSNIFWIGLIC